jgi:hypothetical protein
MWAVDTKGAVVLQVEGPNGTFRTIIFDKETLKMLGVDPGASPEKLIENVRGRNGGTLLAYGKSSDGKQAEILPAVFSDTVFEDGRFVVKTQPASDEWTKDDGRFARHNMWYT